MDHFTKEIFTPSVSEVLNVSAATNIYRVKLTDSMVSSLRFSKVNIVRIWIVINADAKAAENIAGWLRTGSSGWPHPFPWWLDDTFTWRGSLWRTYSMGALCICRRCSTHWIQKDLAGGGYPGRIQGRRYIGLQWSGRCQKGKFSVLVFRLDMSCWPCYYRRELASCLLKVPFQWTTTKSVPCYIPNTLFCKSVN